MQAAAARGSRAHVTAVKRQSRNGVYDYYNAPWSVSERRLRRILRDVKSILIPFCPLGRSVLLRPPVSRQSSRVLRAIQQKRQYSSPPSSVFS